MKCLVLCSSPISHIIPLQPLIKHFSENNVEVYAISTLKNKERLERYGATFVEYPFDFTGGSKLDNVLEMSKKFNKLIYKKEFELAYTTYVKDDIKSMYNHNFNDLELLLNIAKKINPDFILRDAVDRYGNLISKMMMIPCIGYITHNLYSKKFFEYNPQNLYKIFMRSLGKGASYLSDYFENFRLLCENINTDIFLESDTFKINTHHQFDPQEDFTIINSTYLLQPKISFSDHKKYFCLYPLVSRFSVENNISEDLKHFIESSDKIVYIASGSMLAFPLEYYEKLIQGLTKNGFKIVISLNSRIEELNKNIQEKDKESVLIYSYVPQQYVLSHSKLFITSGGQNSILESIFHKVPMLVIPITSEQSLNGLIVEKKNLGKTTYIERESHRTIGSLISEILGNPIYGQELERFSNDIRENQQNYDEIWEYLKNVR